MLLPQLSPTLRSAVAVRITGAIIGGQMGGDKECPVSGVTMQLGQSFEEGCRKARLAVCPGGCGLVLGGQCHKALVDSASSPARLQSFCSKLRQCNRRFYHIELCLDLLTSLRNNRILRTCFLIPIWSKTTSVERVSGNKSVPFRVGYILQTCCCP